MTLRSIEPDCAEVPIDTFFLTAALFCYFHYFIALFSLSSVRKEERYKIPACVPGRAFLYYA